MASGVPASVRARINLRRTLDLTNQVTRAQATADNSRQMVLNRDPTLNQVKATADTLPTTLAQAQQEHVLLQQQIDALKSQLDAIVAHAATKQEKRGTSTQVVALGATVDIPITWDTPFTDANYLTIPLLDATGGLANVGPPAVKPGTQTEAGVTITMRANVALLSGVAVNVIGLRFG